MHMQSTHVYILHTSICKEGEFLFWTLLTHPFSPQHQHPAITISSRTETDGCSLPLPHTPLLPPPRSVSLFCATAKLLKRVELLSFPVSHPPTLSLTSVSSLSMVPLHNLSKSTATYQTRLHIETLLLGIPCPFPMLRGAFLLPYHVSFLMSHFQCSGLKPMPFVHAAHVLPALFLSSLLPFFSEFFQLKV